jgi:hypothetical protein
MSTMTRPFENATTAGLTRWQRIGPVITLLVLSPVLAELHFGAIRFTVLFALIPAIGAWGCGSLLIRELVLIRGLAWDAALLLGIALSIAEECIIQQTSFAPLVGLDPENIYGRAFGVNWPYFLWAMGYESVWAVIIPIFLVEVSFPLRRHERWTGRRGLIIASIVFGLASFIAWYLWTQIMIPQLFPESAYTVSWLQFSIAILAIVVIVAAALTRRTSTTAKSLKAGTVPDRWIVGITGLIPGLVWFGLVFLAYGSLPALPPVIPMALGIILAVFTLFVFASWSASQVWSDVHAIALSLAALTSSMLAGFLILKAGAAPIVDFAGKAILNVVVIIWLCRKIQKPAFS